jgi:hypothetical protein
LYWLNGSCIAGACATSPLPRQSVTLTVPVDVRDLHLPVGSRAQAEAAISPLFYGLAAENQAAVAKALRAAWS